MISLVSCFTVTLFCIIGYYMFEGGLIYCQDQGPTPGPKVKVRTLSGQLQLKSGT